LWLHFPENHHLLICTTIQDHLELRATSYAHHYYWRRLRLPVPYPKRYPLPKAQAQIPCLTPTPTATPTATTVPALTARQYKRTLIAFIAVPDDSEPRIGSHACPRLAPIPCPAPIPTASPYFHARHLFLCPFPAPIATTYLHYYPPLPTTTT
jgi:hypothetical protein